MTVHLLDADIICFRCAASAEEEPIDIAIARVDNLMTQLLDGSSSYLAFLTGKNNFRYEIYPEYKANRKDKPKPKWLADCRNYLIKEYNAIVTDGYEADDALGFNQTEDSIIFSIDKDLLMIPGHHYNWVKQEYKEVGHLDGIRTLYKQALIGDVSDNIIGVAGIGKVKASKIIDILNTEEEMFLAVKNLYDNYDRCIMNLSCLWIMRKENETFLQRSDFKV